MSDFLIVLSAVTTGGVLATLGIWLWLRKAEVPDEDT